MRDAQALEHFAGAAAKGSTEAVPSYLRVLAPFEILWFLLKAFLIAKCFLHVLDGSLNHNFCSANAHKTKSIFDHTGISFPKLLF